MKRAAIFITGLVLAWAGIEGGSPVSAQEGPRYRITITNQTPGQVITPPVVITHSGNFSLFDVGEAAIPELAALAEDGVTAPLTGFLENQPDVFDFSVGGGPIFPGESLNVEVTAFSRIGQITIVGMLATSNDAFFALNGVPLPKEKTATFNVPAYDAGTETNSESCVFVPGPPCGSGGAHDPSEAEGFVHIHSGIHGVEDLSPEIHDWKNPVAKISIRRVQ